MSNRDEYNFELFVVFAFEFVQAASEFGVGHEQLSKLHKGAHDLDILTVIARSLFSTLESIATPCSVKT